MTTPYHSRAAIGLVAARATPPAIDSEGQTVHYGGDSPWGNADRSTAARFEATSDHNRCATIWRAWQSFHMRPITQGGRGWTDIAYNSGVCPHGHRYEGRGPGRRSGANGTNTGNTRSTATCYIAGDGDPVTNPAKLAIVDEGIRMGRGLRWNHADWKPTKCAGDPIRAWQAAGWPAPTTPTTEETFMALSDDEQERLLRRVDALWDRLGVTGPIDQHPTKDRSVVERRVSALYLALPELLQARVDVDVDELAVLLVDGMNDEMATAVADELDRRARERLGS